MKSASKKYDSYPGNASAINDSASAMTIMFARKAQEMGVSILAKVLSTATKGVGRNIMGIGPVSSSKKALDEADMSLDEMELIETDDVVAQYLACRKR